jgi:non-specific serine/threonine protein kinase
MPLVAHTRLGPYEIVSPVGAGGMGEVYRACDTRLDRDVAIKVLPDELARDSQALARFHREARSVAALSHPNILTIHDVGGESGSAYIVTELLEGKTLAKMLEPGQLEWHKSVEIALAIAHGMSSAHAKGIIHRDLKPSNVFVTTDGVVKILDFGLARLAHPESRAEDVTRAPSQTSPGTMLGTVAYMSPEQVRGRPADVRSDIFAFGSMLYEMLLGHRPFAGSTMADSIASILHDSPSALTQSGWHRPAELDRLILRCLEKEPDLRYQSFRDIVSALGSLGRSALTGAIGDVAAAAAAAAATAAPTSTDSNRPPPPPSSSSGAPSVAVLPFENVSSDPENEYFSDGLAEELISALTRVEGLRVASRTSSFAFKGRSDDVRRIGQQLNVRAVLEGSVRKAGNRLRITAQLVNAADGFQLWSEVFNRELVDVFAIQDEIAVSIVKALRGILTESEKRAIVEKATPAPADIQAYDYYLRGRQFFHQFCRRGFEFAQRLFSGAIALDPNYARAHAGLADCHSLLFTYWDTSPSHVQQADAASRRALALDPSLAEAHVARGLASGIKKQYAEAEREFQEAMQLDPALFEAVYFFARTCLAQGKLVEAAQLFEQACRLSPDEYQASSHLASLYNGLGRHADADAASRRALGVIERHLELHPEDARAMYLGAVSLSQLHQPERALEWVTRAVALDPEEPVTLYNAACVYALQGQVERAMECLEKSVRSGFAHKEWIEHDADLSSLRSQLRYEAMIKSLRGSGES